MRRITVFHDMIPGNGQFTIFNGQKVRLDIDEQGILTVIDWETPDATGEASFAHGRWTYVICSVEKEK